MDKIFFNATSGLFHSEGLTINHIESFDARVQKLEAEPGSQIQRDLGKGSHLHDILQYELSTASNNGGSLAVLLVDLEGFACRNNQDGSSISNQTLNRIITTIIGAVRDGDMVFRYGDEGFAVILQGADRPDLLSMRARLLGAIRHIPHLLNDADPSITGSIRIATHNKSARFSSSKEILQAVGAN